MEAEELAGETGEREGAVAEVAPPSREEFEALAAEVRRLAAQVANLRA